MKRTHRNDSGGENNGVNRGDNSAKTSFSGVTISRDELYHLHRDALGLISSSDTMVSSLFPGAYKALFHGRGLEFEEVRAYQWGDDYRSIDWRVTARTGQMHTKLFHEERERSLYLLIDGSETMHFGTRQQFKWVLAARIAAIFGWLAYENGDRVAAMVIGDSERVRFQPPGIGESALVKVFRLLAQKEPQVRHKSYHGETSSQLIDGLKYLQRVARNDALILILSDFRNFDVATEKQLGMLAHRFEVAIIRLYDPMEKQLPLTGCYPVSNGQQTIRVDVTQHGMAESYQQRFNEEQQNLLQVFKKYAVAAHLLGTQEDLMDSLRRISRR